LKKLPFLLLILLVSFQLKAQPANCTFLQPVVKINFGNASSLNQQSAQSVNYSRVTSSCPTDGHYSFVPNTSGCFRGDWVTLFEDHTPGDIDGNMMIVNASYNTGMFMNTSVSGLKGSTIYEFSVWMMNVCRITEKCPFPLLPNITIMLQSADGKVVARLGLGEIPRKESPQWTQYKILFTTPAAATPLTLSMINSSPGGCGNDFALDDISFRECVKTKPVITAKTKAPAATKKPTAGSKPVVAKTTASKPPVSKPLTKTITTKPATSKPVASKTGTPKPATGKQAVPNEAATNGSTPPKGIAEAKIDPPAQTAPVVKPKTQVLAPAPRVLTTRANELVKKIGTDAGLVRIDLYDNGTIDGDTVSIYHNNTLVVARARLSEKAVSFQITIDTENPHHELTMVANNLGSIPPNTSLMIVTSRGKRYEVFISSNEQKNAKVVLELNQ
jgi:hypothetical protein